MQPILRGVLCQINQLMLLQEHRMHDRSPGRNLRSCKELQQRLFLFRKSSRRYNCGESFVVEKRFHSDICSSFFSFCWHLTMQRGGRNSLVRAISFLVKFLMLIRAAHFSCGSFFSCSSFFHAAHHVVEVSFSEFSCHSAGIVWLPLIMQVTVYRLALTVFRFVEFCAMFIVDSDSLFKSASIGSCI